MSAHADSLIRLRSSALERLFGQLPDLRILVIGIGGGGDAVGALPLCFELADRGAFVAVAGISWKRRMHDPAHRPRRIEEFRNLLAAYPHIGRVGPDTVTVEGVRHVESELAAAEPRFPVFTIDISGGSGAVAEALRSLSAGSQGFDIVIGVDIGGDALCAGSEPGLESPLCDQTMIAALCEIPRAYLAVHGLGTDGELSYPEFRNRFLPLQAGGAFHGAIDLNPDHHERMREILLSAKTECSRYPLAVSERLGSDRRVQLLERCAAGSLDTAHVALLQEALPLREGARTGHLSELTALYLFFDPRAVHAGSDYSRFWDRDADLSEIARRFRERSIRIEFDAASV